MGGHLLCHEPQHGGLHDGYQVCVALITYCHDADISFGPVAPQAAEYYGVSGNMIDLFPIVGMAINMPGMFIAVYCIDRFGIKVRTTEESIREYNIS
jgi:hypothetical protein